jgi:RecA-family ATPase
MEAMTQNNKPLLGIAEVLEKELEKESRPHMKAIQKVELDLPTLTDIAKLDVKVEWVVDKLIPEQAVTMLYGKGGIGKTWLLLELGRCVAEGVNFFGLSTKKIPVYYIDFENPLPVLWERAKKLGQSLMKVWHLSVDPSPPKIDSNKWEAYKNLEPGLIIFDSFRASHDREENSSTEMAGVISRLKELRALKFSIVLIHHTPKNSETFRGLRLLLT